MPNAVDETSAVTATVFATRHCRRTLRAPSSRRSPSTRGPPRSSPRATASRAVTKLRRSWRRANRVGDPGAAVGERIYRNQPADQRCRHERRSRSAAAPRPAGRIRKQSGGCSLVSSRTECALGTSLTAPVRMPEIGTSGSMIVVFEKGQCESHKIEIKISARVSISIFHARSPVNGARRSYHVPVIGGRAIGDIHLPAFLYRRCKKRWQFSRPSTAWANVGLFREGGRTSRREP